MKREPKIVQRANDTYSVTTGFRAGCHWLVDGEWRKRYSNELPNEARGVFKDRKQAAAALAAAPPVPADAVWDDDCEVAEPQPELAWKPIAETQEELRGMGGDSIVDVLFADDEIRSFAAWKCLDYYTGDAWKDAHWTIIPRPKPAPTEAELERAVVEAAIAVHASRNGEGDTSVWREFDERIDALLAARERAKGGGK